MDLKLNLRGWRIYRNVLHIGDIMGVIATKNDSNFTVQFSEIFLSSSKIFQVVNKISLPIYIKKKLAIRLSTKIYILAVDPSYFILNNNDVYRSNNLCKYFNNKRKYHKLLEF